MALTSDELQSIVTQVLSALRTNSNTIGQLPPVISLGAEDSFEIDGGKRVTYETLYALINYINDERHKNLSSELGNLKRDHSADVGAIRDRIAAVIRILEEHGSSISENKSTIDNIGDYIIPEEIQPRIDHNRALIERLNDSVGAPERTVTDDAGTATVPGIAPLDESGRVPGRFLPSYVDDAMDFDGMTVNVAAFAGERYEGELRGTLHRVLYLVGPNRFILEVTPSSTTGKPQAPEYYPKWELGEEHALCMGRESEEGYVPLKGKTYYCPATNKAYRWTGSSLVPTGSDLDLGEEAGTAFAGDRGRALELEKADRTELSPVMVRDTGEGAEMPEPDFPALMLRKNEQALTAEERRQVMVNLGRPDTAAFDLQWAGAGGTVFVPGELYGLNGINDITLAEAMKIWRLSHRDIKVSWQRVYGYNNAIHEEMKPRMFARTYFTLLAPGYEGANFAETFLGNEIVEAVDIAGGYSPGGIHIGLVSTFNGCKRLRRVSFGGGKGWGSIRCNTNAFAGCVNLERIDEFGFWAGGQTLDLSMAPKFEVDCIERAVAAAGTQHQNAIILHPDVFAKCSPELLAAAETKTITITTP